MRGKSLSKEIVPSKDSYFLGALFLFLEIVVGTSIVAIIKYFSSEVSLGVVLMFRYLFCLVFERNPNSKICIFKSACAVPCGAKKRGVVSGRWSKFFI